MSSESGLKAVAAAMDAGFARRRRAGQHFDLSRNRVLIIDAGALCRRAGAAGIAWLVAGTQFNARGLAGAALGGMLGGIAVAAYATRNLDAQDAATSWGPPPRRCPRSSRATPTAAGASARPGRSRCSTAAAPA